MFNIHKWEIGDKLRILDISKIDLAEEAGYKQGEIYEVVNVDESDNTPELKSLVDGRSNFVFYKNETEYLKLVE